MYINTNFRLAMIPNTSYEDNFKFSTDEIMQKVYKERIKDHLQEYAAYPDHLFDMIHFIEKDYETALWDGYIPIA